MATGPDRRDRASACAERAGASFGQTPSGAGCGRRTTVASYEGYCVKCREKRQFEGEEVELANGRRAAQGTCPICSTKMNRILGKKTT